MDNKLQQGCELHAKYCQSEEKEGNTKRTRDEKSMEII